MYTEFDYPKRTNMFVGYNMTNRTSSLPTDISGVDPFSVFRAPVDCYTDPLTNPDRFALRQSTQDNPNTAVDAGTDLTGIVDQDIRGVSRPQGSGWDIGAYEYH
jgi:hypothetical protein